MRIEFRKITPNRTPFCLETERYHCRGDFRRLSQKLVALDFHLKATDTLLCDRCGESFFHTIDEAMHLKVSDGYFEGEDLDVIEVFDHCVDFDTIVSGEIETVRSDYHFCEKCKENQGE